MNNINQIRNLNFLGGKFKKTYFEEKYKLADVRALRNIILENAYTLTENSDYQSLLVLIDPKVTKSRIIEEWNKAKSTLRLDITKRINILIYHSGQFSSSIKTFNEEIKVELEKKLLKMVMESGILIPSPNVYYEILKILIYRWMKSEGPISSTELSKLAGCSYPTIAGARKRLGKSIEKYTDRTFNLKYFPFEEWEKLLVESDQARSTIWFADTSELEPREPRSLLKRLLKIERDDIAIGGVYGAQYYFHDLDITDSSRLDLTIHCPGSRSDLSFIELLDPALKKVDKLNKAVNLVVHFIRRNKTYFIKGQNNIKWADPVECLLDLQEARLESQAKEFLEYHSKKVK